MAATLTLKRDTFTIELRRGQFEVVVDGAGAGSINRRQTREIPLEPGHHTLQIRSGRYSSKTKEFDLSEESNVNFRCHGANLWPVYLASIFAPNLGIALKHER